MDGYCLDSRLAADASSECPVTLPVVGKTTPGAEPPRAEPGACVLITTGAPLAGGTDAVVMYEDVEEKRGAGEVESITITGPVPPGSHVRRRGEVVGKGDTV